MDEMIFWLSCPFLRDGSDFTALFLHSEANVSKASVGWCDIRKGRVFRHLLLRRSSSGGGFFDETCGD